MSRAYAPGDILPDGAIMGAEITPGVPRPPITRGVVWVTYLTSIEAEKYGWRRNGIEMGEFVQVTR